MTNPSKPPPSAITLPDAAQIRPEIEVYFKEYAQAFSAYNLVGIGALWSMPSLVISNGLCISFSTTNDFIENLQKLCQFYKSVGMTQVQKIVMDIHPISANTVSVRTSDTAFNATGEAIVGWEQAYILQHVNDSWRAIMTIAEGEVTTWAAKDTPLAVKPASSDTIFLD